MAPPQFWKLLGMGQRNAPTIEELIRTERALEGMRAGTDAERAWQLQQMRRVRQLANDFDELQPEALPNLSLDELRRSSRTGGPKRSLHQELMDRPLGDEPPGVMHPVGQRFAPSPFDRQPRGGNFGGPRQNPLEDEGDWREGFGAPSPPAPPRRDPWAPIPDEGEIEPWKEGVGAGRPPYPPPDPYGPDPFGPSTFVPTKRRGQSMGFAAGGGGGDRPFRYKGEIVKPTIEDSWHKMIGDRVWIQQQLEDITSMDPGEFAGYFSGKSQQDVIADLQGQLADMDARMERMRKTTLRPRMKEIFGDGGPGFAARWDEEGRRSADEALRKSQQGQKAFIDRRMGEIGDQLIYLENQKGTMDPAHYDSLKRALTNEYESLNQRRLGVKQQARRSGTAGPDDAEGELTAIQQMIQGAHKRGVGKAEMKKRLVDLYEQNMTALPQDLDERTRWILENYDEIANEIEKLPIGSRGGGKTGLGEVIDVMNLPNLDTGRFDLPDWMQNVKRIPSVLPISDEQRARSQEDFKRYGGNAIGYARRLNTSSQVAPYTPPSERVQMAAGIGGAVLEAMGVIADPALAVAAEQFARTDEPIPAPGRTSRMGFSEAVPDVTSRMSAPRSARARAILYGR